MMAQSREKRTADIFKLGGKVYAFDPTKIPLCLSVFWGATENAVRIQNCAAITAYCRVEIV